MQAEFFSWETLGTFAGATTFVALLVQVSKDLIDKLPFYVPTQIYVYVVSLLTLILSQYFTIGLDFKSGFLCVFNAVLVAVSAIGGYEIIQNILKK